MRTRRGCSFAIEMLILRRRLFWWWMHFWLKVDLKCLQYTISTHATQCKVFKLLTWLLRLFLVESHTGKRRLVAPIPAHLARRRQIRLHHVVTAEQRARRAARTT
jgi:hypothetical protein